MEIDYSNIKVIGFDADDTLWVNETYFREAEDKFAKLLSKYETANKIDQELFKKEIENLPLYGYGVKGFVLSMVESALELSNHHVSNNIINEILEIGKDMLNKPVELLEGVEETLKSLNKDFRIILVTKGDLLDQERKLKKSGLSTYFHHIEIVSDKKVDNYSNLLKSLDIDASEFLMVGNSLKSDVLPLISLGAKAVHIPFHTTWMHEQIEDQDHKADDYQTLESLKQLKAIFERERQLR
ncbi:putative hydrolase of the HAD superfamily [Flavobacteriaceae bacterium MAR_2010_188]|nr:putative hydrolase of the HAD superfamily [Flavobacteriaceae bacterium MAR_2010_188]